MIDLIVIIALILILIGIYRLTKPSGNACDHCSGNCNGCYVNIYEAYRKDHPRV